MRVSTWMLIFMNDLKFESKGPAAMDSGLAAISIPFSLFFLLLTFIYSHIFWLPFIFLISVWLNGYFKFYKFIFINNPQFFIYAIILNIWFSTVISLGAFWGLLKWIKGERAIIKQIK